MSTADDTKDALATALADRYELLHELGRGGMATVYLARDLQHNAQVAIKVLRPDIAMSAGGTRFTREIQITAGLQHPNIVTVLGSGSAAGMPYFVMPYVEGESLGQRLQRETRLPLAEAVRLTAEVAEGLAHAHAAGFVHRDIKPANILLSHGHAMIADFGVAKALEMSVADRITESGFAVGTVAYMSPEQAGAQSVDGRSDIYSLACVLYEALAGTPPFTGPSAQAILARNAVDPVPNLRTLRQSVPQALQAAIEKGLAKVPEDRFTTATEFRDAITDAATMPIITAITAQPKPAWWRKPRVMATAATVALLAAAAWWRTSTAGPALERNRVIVYPLVLPADWPGATTSGEDVATVIGSAMDGAGQLRWVDGWQLLQPTQRDNIRMLAVADAMQIARQQRCAWAILGRLVARGDSTDVFLELYDVEGDSVVVRTPAQSAATSEAWRGGMRAVTEILPTLISTAVPDVESEWKARPPQAVAHFLLGEAAFRRVQLTTALNEFRAAVEADSSFGIAAVRGAQVATWNHQPTEAGSLIAVALRQPLSPRYRLFATGFQSYLDGRADSAAAQLNAALALDATMSVAWMQLGEVYTHLLPTQGETDSLAEAAFARVHALDSAVTAPLYHLIELRARRGDATGAATLAKQFRAAAADSQLAREATLVSSCTPKGFKNVDLTAMARENPLALVVAAKSLGASSATASCARSSYTTLLRDDTLQTEAADGRRFSALLGLVNVMVGAGQDQAADSLIQSFAERWGYGTSLYLLAAPVVPAFADRAREVATQDSLAGGPDYAAVRFPVRLWELGVWAAKEGRAPVVRAVAADLASRSAAGSRLDTLLAASMAAHAALANGDSLLALRQFERLIQAPAPVDQLTWNEAASLGYDRLVLGRLLIWHKEFARAIGVLSVHDSALPAVYPLYLKASLATRIEAATALNQTPLGTALRARMAAMSGS
ncbi:MAG: serine/threonine-protein kinase [Gemmatimonadota bacterium]